MTIIKKPSVETKSVLADWNRFSWFNGSLEADPAIISHNLSLLTSLGSQQHVLTSISDSNMQVQQALASELIKISSGL